MVLSSRQFRLWAAVPAFACAAALGGCGGVQFEGKAFNAIGLGEKKEQTDKKMADRAPLIVPPAPNLPAPGPRDQIAQPQNWPQDPETVETRKLAEAKAKKEAYYDKGDWSKKRDIDEFKKLSDPMARRPGLIGDLGISKENRADDPDNPGGDASISNTN